MKYCLPDDPATVHFIAECCELGRVDLAMLGRDEWERLARYIRRRFARARIPLPPPFPRLASYADSGRKQKGGAR